MKKKILSIFIACVLLLGLTGCSSIKEIEGKYEYSTDSTNGYYYFKSNHECVWFMLLPSGSSTRAEYKYTIEKNENGKYTVVLENKESGFTYDIIYDDKAKTLYDPELEMTYKRKDS